MRYNSIAKVRKLIRRSVLLLKFISWNVNGLRAIVNKNFLEVFHELDADFF
ncbi:exodeoxyribonuclease III, partial [Enterococcus faecalis]